MLDGRKIKRHKMKIGVLGYGSIGSRHGANIEALGHTLAWYDPNIPGCGDRDKIIEYADAIIVASPSKEHAKDLTDAIDQGKHVLVEKPFGYDCPPLLAGYVKGARMRWGPNHIIATGFNLRFHECVRKAKELITQIGEIQCASFTVYQKTEKPLYLRDGIIRNWCSHEIDLAMYLLGPGEGEIISCNAPLDDQGNDSIEAWITMDFPTVKQKVFIQADYYSDPEQRFFWIAGSEGTIYVDLVKRNVFMGDNKDKRWLVLAANDSFDQNYKDEMEVFITSIEVGRHLSPLATGEDGVAALYAVTQARYKAGLENINYDGQWRNVK
jgi:predicted dehydrogenase